VQETTREETGGEVLAPTPLDGAVSSGGTLAPEMEGAREAATDKHRGLKERHKVDPLPSDRYVVLTGRRS
jgi:hypothetical protein